MPVLFGFRNEIGPLHRYDLLSNVHSRMAKGHRLGNGVLVAHVASDEILEGLDLLGSTGDGSIYPFRGEKH